MTATERPERGALRDYGHRLSCCWYGDRGIVHAARTHWAIFSRSTACGHWVWDKAIRRDGYPGRAAKPITCPECLRVLNELTETERVGEWTEVTA
jgi:hypothetical protein